MNCVVWCDFELPLGGLTLVMEYDKKCIQMTDASNSDAPLEAACNNV